MHLINADLKTLIAKLDDTCLRAADDAATLCEMLRPALYKTFQPAFLGRMQVAPHHAIADDVLERIIRLKLGRIAERVAANLRARFNHGDQLVQAVLARCA